MPFVLSITLYENVYSTISHSSIELVDESQLEEV